MKLATKSIADERYTAESAFSLGRLEMQISHQKRALVGQPERAG